MATFGHTRSDWNREADRTIGGLGISRGKDLQDSIPSNVDVGIHGLSMILTIRSYDEAIVGMHVFGFIDSMITRSQTPSLVVPLVGSVVEMLRLVLRPWWQREIHEMCDRGLTFAAID